VKFNLDKLIELCYSTNEHLKQRAARSVDITLVVRNWLFGYYIVEYENAGAERKEMYGKKLIDTVSTELKNKGLRGVSPTNIRKFREFYESFSIDTEIQQTVSVKSSGSKNQEIQQTLSVGSIQTVLELSSLNELSTFLANMFKLGWSHYVVLLTIDSRDERKFYEYEAVANDWSVRELERQISSSLYERLALSRNKNEIKKLAKQGLVIEQAADIIKNPMVLEFLGLEEKNEYVESDLENAIIDKLEHFLLELGKGFLFEARQKRFTFDNDHFRVDLVFYNRLLRCYVLFDLKCDKLTHQDLGQMQMYVNYFDRYVKTDEEASTIGILLCHSKNDALVELTLPDDSNIYATKYQLYLPSKDELKEKLRLWIKEENID